MISQLYYDSLILKIMAQVPDVKWRYSDNFRVITECNANYPSIYFMFDNLWIETSPQDYLYTDKMMNNCNFLIMPVDLPYNLLGMPIFIDYYTVFEPQSDTIGWAPHKDSAKESPSF